MWLQAWACFCLLILIMFNAMFVQGGVQKEWVTHELSLDHYVVRRTPQKWTEALTACRENNNGSLLVLRAHSELELLQDILEKGTEYWIGLSDDDNEWQWLWVDKNILNTSSLEFVEIEATNISTDLCTLYRKQGKVFQNVSCHLRHCYVCYNGTFAMPVPFNYDNLEFHEKQKTWHEANHMCKSKGWSLPTINSLVDKGIFNYYVLYDESDCTSWWLHHINNQHEVLRWMQDDGCDATILNRENHDLESGTSQSKMCSAIKDEKLMQIPCHNKRPFVCKINGITSHTEADYLSATSVLCIVILVMLAPVLGFIVMKATGFPECGKRKLWVWWNWLRNRHFSSNMTHVDSNLSFYRLRPESDYSVQSTTV